MWACGLDALPCFAQQGHGPWQREKVAEVTRELKVGGATLQVDFAEGELDLTRDVELHHIEAAAKGGYGILRAISR